MRKNKETMPELTEVLLAKIVGIYMESRGWEAFPEVKLSWFSARPDYVAIKDTLVMAVECKKRLSYEVIEQLHRWHEVTGEIATSVNSKTKVLAGMPHLLIAAAFESSPGGPSGLKEKLLKNLKFGYWAVTYEGLEWGDTSRDSYHGYLALDGHRWRVIERIAARIQPGSRRTAEKLIPQLDKDMKRAISGASGSVGGNYSTPFRRTIMKAVAVLEEHKELHMASIIELINTKHGGHHYSKDSTAFQQISKFLREFGLAEPINGLPNYRLTADYKNQIYMSDAATAVQGKKALKQSETNRQLAATKIADQPMLYWEENVFD
jgi:hypothetical protein